VSASPNTLPVPVAPSVAVALLRVTPRRVVAVFVLLLGILAALLFEMARSTSATWDEPHHLVDGYMIWKHGDFGLNPEVPPLVKMVAALPLLHMPLREPQLQGRSIPDEAYSDGGAFVYQQAGHPDRILLPARMACAVFTLGLALLLGIVGWRIFGPVAGLIAMAFLVFDPNVLANGALVTTDIASALSLLGTMYAWYCYCKSPTWTRRSDWARLALTGLLAGLALAAKYTGILLVPMLLLLALGEGLLRRSGRVALRLVAAWAGVVAVALLVVWSFYGFRYNARPDGLELKPTLAQHLSQLPNPADAQHLALLARGHILPEGYLWGLADTKYIAAVSPSYFFGEVYLHGKRMYFPAAILIKSTLPFLLLLPVLVYAWVARRWRPYRELLFVTVPVALYLAVAINSEMNIGVRHVLPIYPFLYLLEAGAVASLALRSRRWRVALGVLIVWQIATTLHLAPGSYMAYANEAWGGPSQTHRYLSDANVDWGQQLKAAKQYLDERGIKDCWMVYFADGAIEPRDYGIPCKRLPTVTTLGLRLPEEVPAAIDGTVLVSHGDLVGIEFGQGELNPYAGFLKQRPVAAIQHGVYVYEGHFEVPLASALVHAQKAGSLLDANQLEAARTEAEQAVALAPRSAWVQTALGDVLARQGHSAEALAHYRAALQLATTVEPPLQANRVPSLQQKIGALAGR
jgi:Dolichyl-phosphate-mannose-protein mannosyltransferase